MASTLHPEITTGTPATIHLYTDDRAAVVTRRTAKRVYIARVETTNRRRESDNLAAGEMPVMLEDGIVTQPLGAGEAYTLYTRQDGSAYATRGDKSIRVTFGRSITRVDYKF